MTDAFASIKPGDLVAEDCPHDWGYVKVRLHRVARMTATRFYTTWQDAREECWSRDRGSRVPKQTGYERRRVRPATADDIAANSIGQLRDRVRLLVGKIDRADLRKLDLDILESFERVLAAALAQVEAPDAEPKP